VEALLAAIARLEHLDDMRPLLDPLALLCVPETHSIAEP
jgi:hypothetical protein